MLKQSIALGFVTLALIAGAPAYAKKDGGSMSPQHMSQQGRETANSPMLGQEKGQMRSMDRKSAEGLEHGMAGQQEGQGKAQGHTKDYGRGKAKGHSK